MVSFIFHLTGLARFSFLSGGASRSAETTVNLSPSRRRRASVQNRGQTGPRGRCRTRSAV